MRVLITGGAGFIGSNFVLRACALRPDWRVTVLDALTYAANPASLEPAMSRISFIVGSILDVDLVNDLVSSNDLIVHFAAHSHNDNSLHDPFPFVQTNILGTYHLIQAACQSDVRFHLISTDEVFGDLPIGDVGRFTENSSIRPSSPYSSTKASSELLVRAWIRSYGLRATISNCSNNYGPRQHPEKFIPRQITALLEGKRPRLYGDGRNVRDWIHVDDHNDAVLSILERGHVGETYLVGADGEYSNLELLQLILKIMGAPSDFFDLVPDRPGHDLRYAIDASKLREETSWRPVFTDIYSGLASTVRWYQENPAWWKKARHESETRYSLTGQ